MRTLTQALRAVLVETVGVVAVLWMLFGTASWTVENYLESEPQSKPIVAATGAADEMTQAGFALFDLRRPITETAPIGQTDSTQVAQRLDHYSEVYRRAAENYLAHLVRTSKSD